MIRVRLVGARPVKPAPGDLWPAPWMLARFLSVEYLRDWNGVRPPLVLCLPDGTELCLDAMRDRETGRGWSISGLVPDITATPILEGARWRGYLLDGWLGEDVDGRTQA